MPYCPKCGNVMQNDDRFCRKCGKAVYNNENQSSQVYEEQNYFKKAEVFPQKQYHSTRQTVYEGTIHKCPNCGEVVNSFTTNCHSCGFEFRDVRTGSAVEELSRQIQILESKRGTSIVSSIFQSSAFDTISIQESKIISSFYVPNTKEDVLEFMILASSNIVDNPTDLKCYNAWVSKTEQVYMKAKASFGNDPDFERIEKIYKHKMKSVRNRKIMLLSILIISFFFLGFILIMPLGHFSSEYKKEMALERELNAIVEEIQVDIKEENYDSALIKANSLYFDKSLSTSKYKEWNEQRKSLIKLINEKKKESKK